MKPRLFISSSAEALRKAEFVKSELESVVDCVIWTEGVFKLNTSALDTLLLESVVSDYSVFLATPDDFMESRGEAFTIPRDNIIFEFALFLGAKGKRKTFLLAHKDVKLPSDMQGIVVGIYDQEVTGHDSLRAKCEEIKKSIQNSAGFGELGWLPSTALAIGYFQSFVRSVCEVMHAGAKVHHENSPINTNDFKLHILLPKVLSDDFANSPMIYAKRHGLVKGVIEHPTGITGKRGYGLHMKIDPSESDIAHLYDIPMTLNTISETIRLFLGVTYVGKDDNWKHLEARELNNFSTVLGTLIAQNDCSKHNVVIEEFE